MQLLTNSRRSAFQRCRREHFYSYELGVKPVRRPGALSFGGIYHAALEAWWVAWQEGHSSAALETALAATDAAFGADADENTELNIFDLVKVQELIKGYNYRWTSAMEDGWVVLAVEPEFAAPLVNPKSGRPSRTFNLAGKIDAIAMDPQGRAWVIEHKTTSADISPGSDYWLRLRIDSQVSFYFDGARALGHDVFGCIYDVARKPMLQPYKATPEEKRKFKADGTLYANLRANDETAEEYRARIAEAIGSDPNKTFARGEVLRLDSDLVEYRGDAWMTAVAIREAQLQECHPRNPDACVRYGRFCEFFDACTGVAEISDESRFRRSAPHEELLQLGAPEAQ